MGLDQLGAFMVSLERMESGGRNHGPNASRASGYFQIVPGTWGGYGGYSQAYLAPRSVQVARAKQLLTSYYNTYRDWWLVAVAWHAGPGNANRAQRDRGYAYRIGDVNMKTGNYADRVAGGMGGGGGGGGGTKSLSVSQVGATGGGSFGNDLGFQQMDPASARAAAKSMYGYLGWYVDHPEVGGIIVQAAMQGWDVNRLMGALTATRWWRTTSESARQWGALVQSDPATAERRVDETAGSINLQAQKLGVVLGRNTAGRIAVAALKYGWNPAEIQLSIAAHMKYSPRTAERGVIGSTMNDVRKLGAQYLIPINRKQSWQWARRIASGGGSMEGVQAQVQKLSKARFPHLAKVIAQGVTPAEYFAPHRNAIASILEVSPDSVNFLSSKWNPIMAYRAPSGDRKLRAMTVSEAERYARMQPEWKGTANAWQSVTEAGDAIMQLFGAVSR